MHDLCAILCLPNLRIPPEIAKQNDLIDTPGHGSLLIIRHEARKLAARRAQRKRFFGFFLDVIGIADQSQLSSQCAVCRCFGFVLLKSNDISAGGAQRAASSPGDNHAGLAPRTKCDIQPVERPQLAIVDLAIAGKLKDGQEIVI